MENVIYDGRYYDRYYDLDLTNNSILFPLFRNVILDLKKFSLDDISEIAKEPYEDESDTLLLNDMYTFRHPDVIQEYLNSNELLHPILAEAVDKIEHFFPEAFLFLEVISNPEEESDTHLVIFIKTNVPPTEAVEKLDQLDEEWFLNLPADIMKQLSINLEF